jgi:hypothetical protein
MILTPQTTESLLPVPKRPQQNLLLNRRLAAATILGEKQFGGNEGKLKHKFKFSRS